MSVHHRVAIVASLFRAADLEVMIAAAKTVLAEKGMDVVTVCRVPGAYEMPLATRRLLLRADVDAVIVLGIVERGDTAHGRVLGQTVSDALVRLQLEHMKPIGMGIVGPDAVPSQIAFFRENQAKAAANAVHVMLAADA
jgi:6,7-dimethyl-8-ribityllumazine synthase